MYKFKVLRIITTGALLSTILIACSEKDRSANAQNEEVFVGGSTNIHHKIVVDKETGCQYIQGQSSNSTYFYLSPRLSQSGRPICEYQ